MKLVIELRDQDYQYCLDYASGKTRTMALNYIHSITHVVANGTPLPKGHGDLIDAAKLNVALLMGGLYGNKTAIQVIDEAKPIIEADREEQE